MDRDISLFEVGIVSVFVIYFGNVFLYFEFVYRDCSFTYCNEFEVEFFEY
jgi:hypothetical protein